MKNIYELLEQVQKETLQLQDILYFPEVKLALTYEQAKDVTNFKNHLKQAVSNYNSHAFLADEPLLDFDDLHTKYDEYMSVLEVYH